MKTSYKVIITILFIGFSILGNAQSNDERLARIEERLNLMIGDGLGLDKPLTIALNGSLQELVTFLAESTNLNLSLDTKVATTVSVNFTDVLVRDILLYLCDNYELDIKPTGSIVHLIGYEPPPIEIAEKELLIDFDPASGLFSLNLKNNPIQEVSQKISELSGQNIAISPLIRNTSVSGYINNMPLDATLRQLVVNNGLEVEQKGNYFLIKEIGDEDAFGRKKDQAKDTNTTSKDKSGQALLVKKVGSDQINILAENIPILEIAKAAGDELNANYIFLPEVQAMLNTNRNNDSRNNNNRNQRNTSSNSSSGEELISIRMKSVNYNELLNDLFKNSKYTFRRNVDKYYIGFREAEYLRATRVVQLQFRSARGIMDLIPEVMQSEVQVDSLFELNSLVLSGSKKGVEAIVDFIHRVDKVVPVVSIELTIIDISTNRLHEFGVEAGIRQGGVDPGGSIISGQDDGGGVNFSFSPDAINKVLSLLSGRGFLNLGQVTNDFYLSLSALQDAGVIDIKSTPQLATLNSHDATMSIGQKRYFQEQQVNFQGLDRPISVQSNVFREVEANLFIKINPVVSGDDEVTLNIDFEQSEFIGETQLNAPPPQVSRKFGSTIRVRNGETIVLGGLERDLKSDTKRGVPWASRIPLIGGLFGKKRKNKRNDKLLIFVKPIILN